MEVVRTVSQKIQNNAETLLNAYFLKVKLMDGSIQKKVSCIFLPAVIAIMRDVSQAHRPNIFKYLFHVIRMCIHVYQRGGALFGTGSKNSQDTDTLCSAHFGMISKLVVELLKNKTGRSRKVVDRILHSVFIDDLACDMGNKITEYRKASSTDKVTLKLDIELLLADYNEINGKCLTFDNVLNQGVKDEKRRSD